jgi:hypothetical protein
MPCGPKIRVCGGARIAATPETKSPRFGLDSNERRGSLDRFIPAWFQALDRAGADGAFGAGRESHPGDDWLTRISGI